MRRLGPKFSEAAATIEEDCVNGMLWNELVKAIPLPSTFPSCRSLYVQRSLENKVGHGVRGYSKPMRTGLGFWLSHHRANHIAYVRE